MEVNFQGPRFTWARRELLERLDWCIVNKNWLNTWPESNVLHLPKFHSDHRPLLLKVGEDSQGQVPKPFRFINPWVTHEGFGNLITQSWNEGHDYYSSYLSFKFACEKWNREVFGFIPTRKNNLLHRIEDIQKRLEANYNENLADMEASLLSELDKTLIQVEILFQQKARNNWLLFGDQNTSFFHNKTRARECRNHVDMLKIDGNSWCYNQESLRKAVVEFFTDLFTKDERDTPRLTCRTKFPSLNVEDKENLASPISTEEVKVVVFEMGPSKAGGEDGLNAFFFQNQWNVIGESMVEVV